jgi:hypothetical protein
VAGFIAGEGEMPCVPWRIRVNDEPRALFVEDAPPGYVPIVDAMRALAVSRQAVVQRVGRGELKALNVRSERRKACQYWYHNPKPASVDNTPMNAFAMCSVARRQGGRLRQKPDLLVADRGGGHDKYPAAAVY